MNMKILSLAFIALVLTLAVSGCTSTGPTDTGSGGQTAVQQENEVINDLGTDIIDESEEIETGDMI